MKVAQAVHSPDPEGEGHGFSWRTYTVGWQPLLLTHGGRTARSTALISFDPERGTGSVLMATAPGFNDWVARDVLYPEQGARGREVVDVDPSVLARYTGTYASRRGWYRGASGGRYYIRLEDDGYLTYQRPDAVRTRLYPESDSSFFMVRGPLTVTFAHQGEDVRMIIHVDDREQQYRGGSWTAWRTEAETPPPVVVAGNAGATGAWGAGTWLLLGLVGFGVAGAVLRPVWSR